MTIKIRGNQPIVGTLWFYWKKLRLSEILDIAVYSGLIKEIPVEDLKNTRNIAVHQPERIDQAIARNIINKSAQILTQLSQSIIMSNDINKNENEKT